MPNELLDSIAIAALVMFVTMSIVSFLSQRLKNAGIVDVAWSFSFGLLCLVFAYIDNGYFPRKALILAVTLSWSIRLGVYLVLRLIGEHPHEDRRYHALRENWGTRAEIMFFLLFQLQGFLIVILSVPFAVACADPTEFIRTTEWIALGICVLGLAGEIIADAQLQHFKRNPANKDRTCSYGLWNYSRHPNYFFEWIIWCGFFVFVAASPGGWLSFYCPILMLFLLTKVSGVSLAEEHAVKNKGEEYIRYQKNTSAFVPWFKLGRNE